LKRIQFDVGSKEKAERKEKGKSVSHDIAAGVYNPDLPYPLLYQQTKGLILLRIKRVILVFKIDSDVVKSGLKSSNLVTLSVRYIKTLTGRIKFSGFCKPNKLDRLVRIVYKTKRTLVRTLKSRFTR